MKKDTLKKEIIVLMEQFININFEGFLENTARLSDAKIDGEDARKTINDIQEIFIKIKNNASLLDSFSDVELLKIKQTIEHHIKKIDSYSSSYRRFPIDGDYEAIFKHLYAMNDKLPSLKLNEIAKKISLVDWKETEEAVKFFQENKKDYKKAKDIFEQTIKNKDNFIARNISIASSKFNDRRKKIEYIRAIKNNEDESSWRTFLNLRNFWWFALGVFFATNALGFLGYLGYFQFVTKSDFTTSDALLRISSVAILMTLSSFCFLQFSNNKKLIEFYEFKVVALYAFEALSKNHAGDATERQMLFTRAFDVIFREYSFKERSFKNNNVKDFSSQIRDLKDSKDLTE